MGLVRSHESVDREQHVLARAKREAPRLGVRRRRLAPAHAAHGMPFGHALLGRQARFALVDAQLTPRREGTGRPARAGALRDPGDAAEPPRAKVVRHACHEALRIRMARTDGELRGRGPLADEAGVHDRDAIGHRGDGGQIVGHVDERDVELALQAAHLLEDPRLGHHVEPGGGLVEHQQRRIADQRERERDPLLLAAGELVGEAALERRVVGERNPLQRGRGERAGIALDPVDAADLADLVADPSRRVERRRRILRDVGHQATAQ